MTTAPLAYLSLQRVSGHRHPRAPSNDERVRAYRAYMPVQYANAAMNDQLRAIEYARAACADGSTPTTEDFEHEF
jgi:hypothetical protein